MPPRMHVKTAVTFMRPKNTHFYVLPSYNYVQLPCTGLVPMTYDDFLAELGKAGLSVRAFADLIAMNPNSVSNYASTGGVPRHLACIAVLLAEMNIHGVDFQSAIGRVSANRKRPRGGGKPGRFGGDKQEQLELGTDERQHHSTTGRN